ncbi:hypothetical protein ABFS83_04G021700 [Erythranthe nasuta]
MEEGRGLFDASAYMLFEASGDSESQYFGGGALEPDSDAAEDDAQSCSYGSLLFSDSARRLRDEVDAEDSRRGDFDEFSGEEEEDGGGGVSEEDDGVVDQRRGRGNPAAAAVDKEKPMKSNGCEGSNVKMKKEGEGDKLFWEACLAS